MVQSNLNEEMEEFSIAAEKFRQFLASQGYIDEPLWLFRGDLIEFAGRLWLRWPVPSSNVLDAEAEYERGCRQGLGVGLHIWCLAGTQPCCIVNVPADAMDASYQMMAGLKLSMPCKPPRAKRVRQRWLWRLLSLLRHRRSETEIWLPTPMNQ